MEDGGEVVSKYHRYEPDVSSVDREKLAGACKILRHRILTTALL